MSLDRIKYEETSDGCHLCTSHKKHSKKYYYIKVDGKLHLMHRYIYQQLNGEIPDGLVVRHKCDNVYCINPDHLEIGTHKDNMKDMVVRNRSLIGSKNNSSKLQESDVKEIRSSELSNHELSALYSVNERTIRDIRARRSWAHI